MNPDISVLIISYNTRDLLRKCLQSIIQESKDLSHEIIVIDNASKDGSAEMVANEFQDVILIPSEINLGFGQANNLAFKASKGKYIVLLNSDAFLHPGSLQRALDKIKYDPKIGMGGARLVGQDGSWQPSARMFPSLLNEFLQLSGLAGKYPRSKFFGRFNRTWASPDEACETDWIPGAFAIIPRQVLEKLGFFDERFFLYYEEVDLCRRIKQSGYSIWYWPDVIVTHLGGESSKTVNNYVFSPKSAQLELWRMRSELLYFRKYHGWLCAYCMHSMEIGWHWIRAIKNFNNPAKEQESRTMINLMRQAWNETQGGKVCPPKPW